MKNKTNRRNKILLNYLLKIGTFIMDMRNHRIQSMG